MPPPPPPPSPSEVIEDDVEVEEELLVIDADDGEDDFIEEESNPDPFTVVEQMPVFPCITWKGKEYCGDAGLRAYIAKSIKYPSIAKEMTIQGKVFVQFVVDKKGNVSDAKVVRGVDKSLDKEALRVIRSLPKYQPGLQRGEPAKVIYTIPINFVLN